MTFLLVNHSAYYAIVNDDAGFIVGRVYPLRGRQGLYEVISSIGPMRGGATISASSRLSTT